jgi:hypothetical protein
LGEPAYARVVVRGPTSANLDVLSRGLFVSSAEKRG